MPFKSKSQVKKFGALERAGKIPKGTTKRWAKHTPNIKSLPARARPKSKSK